MTNESMDDDRLEALFAEARAAPPQVPEALMARVLADARQVQRMPARGWQGWHGWRGWWRTLGGAPGMGGLVAATCVGFWLGVAPPEGLPDLTSSLLGQDVVLDDETLELTGFGWDSEEG